MTAPPVGVERRIGQRFAYNLPVSLRDIATAAEGLGFTQDLSSRGAFLFTDMALSEGAEIELTLKMPSEITLGENMRVRCRGRVLRIVKPDGQRLETRSLGRDRCRICRDQVRRDQDRRGRLPEATNTSRNEDGSADFRRISALHSRVRRRPATCAASAPRTAAAEHLQAFSADGLSRPPRESAASRAKCRVREQ